MFLRPHSALTMEHLVFKESKGRRETNNIIQPTCTAYAILSVSLVTGTGETALTSAQTGSIWGTVVSINITHIYAGERKYMC